MRDLRLQRWICLLTIVACAACATASSEEAGNRQDARPTADAFPFIDGATGQIDASSDIPDAGIPLPDASTSVSDLDPNLGLPDEEGAPCFSPGSLSECPSIQVCRFFSSNEGRCETCEECGNLNASCSASDQCDILFMCYLGRCTNFCPLGTFACGPIDDCLDIGHATEGVCAPF